MYWTWSTLVGDRIGVLHDLYGRPEHRRRGVGRALIHACLEAAGARGVARLGWDTAPGNAAAQRLYDSLPDVRRSEWVAYSLEVPG
jgi:ribosomal protein S18 acetylase RimI-like enzyme